MADDARNRDEAAALWAVRLEEHGDEPGVREAAEAWLAQDPRRRGDLLRAEAALSLLNRGRALAGLEEPGPASRSRWSRRQLMVGGVGALGAAAAGVAVVVATAGWRSLATDLGEVRKAPLADGSLVAINTESAVQVRMGEALRQVRLERGEAWFKVAHDPERPFVVQAGRVRVRAVGTAFSVRRREAGADVLVTEGAVDAWVDGEEPVRIAAGSRAFVSSAQPSQAVSAPREIENALAWRDGQIALHGETLAAAAEEFNRYNARKLVIEDPELAGERLVGQFSTNEPEAFAHAVAVTLGARITSEPSTLRLSR